MEGGCFPWLRVWSPGLQSQEQGKTGRIEYVKCLHTEGGELVEFSTRKTMVAIAVYS